MEKLLWETKFNTKFDDEFDFLETILKSYGIEDIKTFLNPQRKVLNDPFLFKNMKEAVQILHDNLDKPIIIKVDCDCDGYTSSSVLTGIIRHLNPDANIKYIFSYNKEHGLTYKDLSAYPKDEVGLIIIPDASMKCSDAIQIKRNYPNAPILVIDHHELETDYLDKETGLWVTAQEADELVKKDQNRVKVDCYTNYCTWVNDCDGQYPNSTLSGVGVVRKFGEAYCEQYGIDDKWLDDYLDLISLGIIADSMDVRNPETRWYVLAGLKEESFKNEFLNELQDKMADEIHFGRTITNVGWVLAPRINGVVRYGTEKEQEDLFRAMIGEQETVIYQPRRKKASDPKPEPEEHTLQWEMARVANNVKSRQDTQVRKFMEQIVKKIDEEGLNKNSILFVDCTSLVDKKSVTGLVANKLTSKFCKPVVLLRETSKNEFGGSCRGYDKGPVKNLMEFLSEAGISAHGHSNAAGVTVKKDKLEEAIEKCNQMLPLEDCTTVFPVDWEIPANEMQNNYVREVAENYSIWGNTVPTPTFAISNLRINASQITAYGDNKSFIRFQHNGVTYIKKYCPASDYDNMTLRDRKTFGVNKKNLKLNLICQFQLEVWENKTYPEVKILNYDVVEDKDDDNFEFADSKVTNSKVDKADKNTKSKLAKVDLENDVDWDEIDKPKKKKVIIDDEDFVF